MAEKQLTIKIPNDKFYDLETLGGFTFGTNTYLIQNISNEDSFFIETDTAPTDNSPRGILLEKGFQYEYNNDTVFQKYL